MRDFSDGEKNLLGTLKLSQKCEQEVKKVWIERECGEGGQFSRDEVTSVLFNAIKKYYNEKF